MTTLINEIRFDYSKLLGRIREKGMTQSAMAAQIGITPTAMSNKLAGKSDFRQGELERMAEKLEIADQEYGLYFFTRRLKSV